MVQYLDSPIGMKCFSRLRHFMLWAKIRYFCCDFYFYFFFWKKINSSIVL